MTSASDININAKCKKCPDFSSTLSPALSVSDISICKCFDQNAHPLSDTLNTCRCNANMYGTPVTNKGD